MSLCNLAKISRTLAKAGLIAAAAAVTSLLILRDSCEEEILCIYSSSIIKLIILLYILIFSAIDLWKLKRPIAITLGFGSITAMMLTLFYLGYTSDLEALHAQYLLILGIAAGFYFGIRTAA